MKFFEIVLLALHNLTVHKLRSLLTVLGMVIGVAAVITLLSIGGGVANFIAQQFTELGTNLVFIIPEQEQLFPLGSQSYTESTLTLRDAELMSQPAVLRGATAVASALFRNVELQYNGHAHDILLRAATPNYKDVLNLEVSQGRFFTDSDYHAHSRVVILGPTTVDALFSPEENPIGADIKIQGLRFEVIGLLTAKGASSFGGSRDDIALVPLTTAHERLFNLRSQRTGYFLIDAIVIQSANDAAVNDLIIDASELLRRSHQISFRGEDDFQILTQRDFLEAFGAVTSVFTLFIGAIAGISLLVGGIGIMNIMLVTVTERKFEIGLRKAVGAKQLDILSQFLAEAVMLALSGGLIGVLLGVLGAHAIRWAIPDLDTSVTFDSVGLAVGTVTVIGILSGMYPAYRAAVLNPVDALR